LVGAAAFLAALALHPVPALASVCRTENLMPGFFAFEARTKNLAPDVRADQFVKTFAANHPDFYIDKGLDWPARVRDDSRRLLDPATPEAIPGFPPFSDKRFRAVANGIDGDFEAAQTRFLITFPDFRCEARIAFGPSFLRFDGHGKTDTEGQWHMLFGVDAISLEHGPQDMPVVFAHELFHIYHHQLMGSKARGIDNTVWWAMWEEGLATYVSGRLNPGFDAQQLLVFPQDIIQRMHVPGATARAAKLMLADFDKSGGFWFDTARSSPGLPPRAGYYMGYLMASELGRDHSLDWLAHLPPDQVKRQARAFLEAHAKAR
jgi:hypothetical protein